MYFIALIMKSSALILLVITTSSAIAACPSGYKEKEKYKSTEIQMRFQGGGEFNRCLNQSHPEKNNYRDSWGVSYGDATYKCGDITVRGYLGNPQGLQVMSSVGYVQFNRDGYSRDHKRRNFCKKNTCFEEISDVSNWKHRDTRTRIEFKYIIRKVFEECTKVTF
jgi:hypothetical protein